MDIAQLALTVNSAQVLQATRAMDGFTTSIQKVTLAATSFSKVAAAAPAAGKPAASGSPGSSGGKAAADTKADDKTKKLSPLMTYAKAADKPGDQVNDVFATALGGLETQLVDFATTGKASFKGLGDSLLSSLAHVAIKDEITAPLAKQVDSLISQIFGKSDSDLSDSSGNASGASSNGAITDSVAKTADSVVATADKAGKDGASAEKGKKTLEDYAASVGDTAQEIDEAFAKSFSGLEDQLVNFVTTGKADFKSLADSIISDLARVAVRQATKSLASGLGSVIGGLFGGSGVGEGIAAATAGDVAAAGDGLMFLASGGYTGDGGKYDPKGIVHGGEYVFDKEATNRLGVPYLENLRRGGAPDGGGGGGGAGVGPVAAGGGGISINTNVTVGSGGQDSSDSSGDSAGNAKQLGGMINEQVRSVLVRESRQGGILWNMRNGYGN